MSKDPKTSKLKTLIEEDFVVKVLKDKYFTLLKTENFPWTKDKTKELDNLEAAIRELQDKAANKLANK